MSTADATSITLTGADIPALRRVLDALDNLAGIGVDGAGELDALLDAHVYAAADGDRDKDGDSAQDERSPQDWADAAGLPADVVEDIQRADTTRSDAADRAVVGDPDPYPHLGLARGEGACHDLGPTGYYRCTRPGGHPGQHVAGTAIDVIATWPR